MNTVILTKVKVQPINDDALPYRASIKFRGDKIILGTIYVCDVTHDEILETVFLRGKLHYDEVILEG